MAGWPNGLMTAVYEILHAQLSYTLSTYMHNTCSFCSKDMVELCKMDCCNLICKQLQSWKAMQQHGCTLHPNCNASKLQVLTRSPTGMLAIWLVPSSTVPFVLLILTHASFGLSIALWLGFTAEYKTVRCAHWYCHHNNSPICWRNSYKPPRLNCMLLAILWCKILRC